MSQHPVRVEADGTRIYSNRTRYKPVPQAERKYKTRKPDDPRAFRHFGEWFLPLDLLDDSERSMPETRSDDEVMAHMDRTVMCNCKVCNRPQADWYRRRWREKNGLQR